MFKTNCYHGSGNTGLVFTGTYFWKYKEDNVMSVSILTMFSALKRNKIVMTRGVNQIFWIYHSSVIIYFHLSLITVIFNYFNISLKAIALSYALDKILKPLFQRFKHVKKSFFLEKEGKLNSNSFPWSLHRVLF